MSGRTRDVARNQPTNLTRSGPGVPHDYLLPLVITFLTFGAYWSLKPYGDTTDMTLALIAQAIIFFTLCSSVAQPLSSGKNLRS